MPAAAQYNREKHGGGCPGERGRVDSSPVVNCGHDVDGDGIGIGGTGRHMHGYDGEHTVPAGERKGGCGGVSLSLVQTDAKRARTVQTRTPPRRPRCCCAPS
jgi:hypothetical protein